MGKLQEYRALNIQKDGTGKEIWMPVARNGLQNKEPIEILAQFNGEIRGIYNYYRLARNVSVLNKFCYVMEYSMYKTIAKENAVLRSESQEEIYERPHIWHRIRNKTRDKTGRVLP